MSAPTTFHPFPRLPVELRLKIWSFVHAEPRTVTISCKKGLLSRDIRFAEAFISSTPPPATLHVCQQSRYDALTVYTPLFKTKASDRYTYINFAIDTLRCSDSVLEYIGKEEVQGIERMELEVRDAAYFGHFYMDVVKRMAQLKCLVMECSKSATYQWSRSGMYLETLMRDFQQERHSDPGWEFPEVKIIMRGTGELLHTIPGGALIPGWVKEDGYEEVDMLLNLA